MKRIFHVWSEWECYPAGFYENSPPEGMTTKQAVEAYADFLRDEDAFEEALEIVITEWKNSCEHYLTNEIMNRIAWLGQASACVALKLSSTFRGGFNLLSKEEQARANDQALGALNRWLAQRGEEPVTIEGARSKMKVELY